MRSYYIKYILLFLINVLLIDVIVFMTSDKKEIDLSSLMLLSYAVEIPLDKGDISKVNNIIDSYSEKVIIEREGIIYTSNFAKDQSDRNTFAVEQLQKYKNFWKPLPITSETTAETIYYKIPEINYFNKILMDTLFSLCLGLCVFPILFIGFRDIESLYDSIEHLRQYLVATREQLEHIKNNKISDEFDKSKDKEKLHKKLSESKNKRIALQSDLEKLQSDFDRKINDINSLKETISNLKSDLQNNKIEKNRLEDLKNSAVKEKQEISKKLSSLESELDDRNIEIERGNVKIKELNSVMSQISEHLRIREKEIEKLKVSKINPIEFTEIKEKLSEAQRENIAISDDIRDLLGKLDAKDNHINTLKENVAQLSLDRIKFQNEVSNLRTKTSADRDVIEALVNENNNLKDAIVKLNSDIKDNQFSNPGMQSGAYLDAEYNRLNILLKDKESQVSTLIHENKQKENELREFTLDTLDKLSSLKRYETQVLDMSREIRQKDNLIESINARIDVKDKLINTLNKEMNDLKDKLDKVNNEVKNTSQILSDV
jgi:chromosome segregation ATPase